MDTPPAERRHSLCAPLLRLLLFLAYTPFGGQVWQVEREARGLVDAKLKAYQALHEGDAVAIQGDRLRRGIEAYSTPQALIDTPHLMRDSFQTQLAKTKAVINQAYDKADAAYLGNMLYWRPVRLAAQPFQTIEAIVNDPRISRSIGASSMFHDAAQFFAALDAMPSAVTVDTALAMRDKLNGMIKEALEHVQQAKDQAKASGVATPGGLVDVVEKQLLPALGEVQHVINQQVTPYLVQTWPTLPCHQWGFKATGFGMKIHCPYR